MIENFNLKYPRLYLFWKWAVCREGGMGFHEWWRWINRKD
jgi:hypothetical protein